ncbi:MAG: SCO family protein [Chloroflexi bacterium]|nr:SCO family protein [Chloroflexota bacterium]
MTTPRTLLSLLLGATFIAAACSSAGSGAGNATEAPPAAPEGELWRTIELVDARTGESFTIDSLKGKVIGIEPMAIWCSNCRTQQGEASAALDRLASDDIVFISVDVDPNERPDELAQYSERFGFDWRFVVATPEVARSLAEAFGDQVLSPPSTPFILIDKDGAVVDQHFGIRGADELVDLLTPQLS